MLWEAAQRRLARERRSRLAEQYRAAVDAGLQVLVASGRAKPKGGAWRQPWYAEQPRAEIIRTPETRDRAIAQLAALYPGIVRRPA